MERVGQRKAAMEWEWVGDGTGRVEEGSDGRATKGSVGQGQRKAAMEWEQKAV